MKYLFIIVLLLPIICFGQIELVIQHQFNQDPQAQIDEASLGIGFPIPQTRFSTIYHFTRDPGFRINYELIKQRIWIGITRKFRTVHEQYWQFNYGVSPSGFVRIDVGIDSRSDPGAALGIMFVFPTWSGGKR